MSFQDIPAYVKTLTKSELKTDFDNYDTYNTLEEIPNSEKVTDRFYFITTEKKYYIYDVEINDFTMVLDIVSTGTAINTMKTDIEHLKNKNRFDRLYLNNFNHSHQDEVVTLKYVNDEDINILNNITNNDEMIIRVDAVEIEHVYNDKSVTSKKYVDDKISNSVIQYESLSSNLWINDNTINFATNPTFGIMSVKYIYLDPNEAIGNEMQATSKKYVDDTINNRITSAMSNIQLESSNSNVIVSGKNIDFSQSPVFTNLYVNNGMIRTIGSDICLYESVNDFNNQQYNILIHKGGSAFFRDKVATEKIEIFSDPTEDNHGVNKSYLDTRLDDSRYGSADLNIEVNNITNSIKLADNLRFNNGIKTNAIDAIDNIRIYDQLSFGNLVVPAIDLGKNGNATFAGKVTANMFSSSNAPVATTDLTNKDYVDTAAAYLAGTNLQRQNKIFSTVSSPSFPGRVTALNMTVSTAPTLGTDVTHKDYVDNYVTNYVNSRYTAGSNITVTNGVIALANNVSMGGRLNCPLGLDVKDSLLSLYSGTTKNVEISNTGTAWFMGKVHMNNQLDCAAAPTTNISVVNKGYCDTNSTYTAGSNISITSKAVAVVNAPTFTGRITAPNITVSGVPTGTNDATNKSYVDNLVNLKQNLIPISSANYNRPGRHYTFMLIHYMDGEVKTPIPGEATTAVFRFDPFQNEITLVVNTKFTLTEPQFDNSQQFRFLLPFENNNVSASVNTQILTPFTETFACENIAPVCGGTSDMSIGFVTITSILNGRFMNFTSLHQNTGRYVIRNNMIYNKEVSLNFTIKYTPKSPLVVIS